MSQTIADRCCVEIVNLPLKNENDKYSA